MIFSPVDPKSISTSDSKFQNMEITLRERDTRISPKETISIIWKLFPNPVLNNFQMEPEIDSMPYLFLKKHIHFYVFV